MSAHDYYEIKEILWRIPSNKTVICSGVRSEKEASLIAKHAGRPILFLRNVRDFRGFSPQNGAVFIALSDLKKDEFTLALMLEAKIICTSNARPNSYVEKLNQILDRNEIIDDSSCPSLMCKLALSDLLKQFEDSLKF